jgi:hypothetical protein
VEPGPLDDTTYIGYRRRLIEEIRARGINDLEILQLFDQVPRHIEPEEEVSAILQEIQAQAVA